MTRIRARHVIRDGKNMGKTDPAGPARGMLSCDMPSEPRASRLGAAGAGATVPGRQGLKAWRFARLIPLACICASLLLAPLSAWGNALGAAKPPEGRPGSLLQQVQHQETALRPAVIFDSGDEDTNAFEASIRKGLTRFRDETGIGFRSTRALGPREEEALTDKLIEEGANFLIFAYYSSADLVARKAAEYPEIRFVLIDAVVEAPNVESITFKEHEGSYLVGMLAGMVSKTGRLGFIGGTDAPFIRRFGCGFLQGARSQNPDITLLEDYVGTVVSGWDDAERAANLARSQFIAGADIIYHAAGASGLGVIAAAKKADRLAIGVDSNQNGIAPGHVLTSMVKRVDVAAYLSLKRAHEGHWYGGHTSLGLAENAVGWAFDRHNAMLVDDAMFETLETTKLRIIGNVIQVHDYIEDETCPLQ